MSAPPLSEAGSFRYRASTQAGKIVDGVVRATSRDDALRELHRQQLWPVSVDRVERGLRRPLSAAGGGAARRRGVALWTRTVATLLTAGATLDRALSVAATQASERNVQTAATQMRTAVQGGASLSDAMQAHPALFRPLHAGVVRAGEAAGSLGTACETLAGYLDDDEALRAQVRGALMYPAFMAVVATAGVLIMLLGVIPRFATMLSDLGGTLPLSTRILVAVGGFVAHWWWLTLAFLAIGAVAAQRALVMPTMRRAWHEWRLSLPVTGALERTLVTARFVRALGMMLQAGLPLLPALKLARSGVGNLAMAESLELAEQQVARGDRLAESLTGVVTPMAVQLLAVGEESGQLDALALRAATQHDIEVRRTLTVLASLLEPALILLFGGIVGFVALAMLQAIYAVNAGM